MNCSDNLADVFHREGFDLSTDEVCGAVLWNRSKGDKIARH